MIDIQTILTYLTLISVPVGVAYHIMTLYNTRKNQKLTLETRQAQLFMQLYQRTINEESNRKWSNQMLYQWKNYEDFDKKYGPNSEDNATILHTTWQQFNGVGLLLRRGLIDRETAYGLSGGWRAVLIWVKWKDIIVEMRKRYFNPDYMDGLEYLGVEMMKYREEKGLPNILPTRFQA
jgi:hypothetical protein